MTYVNDKDKDEETLEDIGFSLGKVEKDPRIVEINDEEELFDRAVELVVAVTNMKKQQINIALSGGSLKKFYKYMAEKYSYIFENTVFWQVDERWVDHENSNSNFKMQKESLIDRIGKYGYKDYKYFDTEAETIDDALRKYEFELTKNSKDLIFDLIILGIGSDGHIGSIFPGSDAVEEVEKLTAHTQTERFDIEDRVTLTFPAILSSREVLVLVQGEEKKKIIDKLQNPEVLPETLPAKKILQHPSTRIFFGNYEIE